VCVRIFLTALHILYNIALMAYVYINPYKSSLLAAQQELEQLKTELQLVTHRIAQLEATIKALEPLASEPGSVPPEGLSELCRQILMSQPNAAFTASDVMRYLAGMGVDISGYASPLAVLHTTLGRLAKPGTGFLKTPGHEGQPFYSYDERHRTKFRFPRFGVK